MEHRTVSIADQVFEILEKDILTGVHARRDLDGDQAQRKLGVSRTPIREALRRLEQERLVVGHRGMRVVGLDMSDIEDIYDTLPRGVASPPAAPPSAPPEQLDELKRIPTTVERGRDCAPCAQPELARLKPWLRPAFENAKERFPSCLHPATG